MFGGISVGVEKGGVPVAKGLVAFGGVEGEAEVAAGESVHINPPRKR